MLSIACFFCLAQCSFAAQPYLDDPGSEDARYVWLIFCTFAAFVVPFALLLRERYPEPLFWVCAAVVAVFPYAPMLELMAMGSALARGTGRNRTLRLVFAGTAVAVWAELRDALQPADASVWHLIFAKPHTGQDGQEIVMLTGEATIVATATVVALVETTIAVLIGLHIRSRARLRTADAKAHAAQTKVDVLQSDLTNQRLADAIAAEAHDTLAHSLSLIALNASALAAEANRLGDTPGASTIASLAHDIRRQSAGALDEAHAIIDMLRDPQRAWEQLMPTDETSLTRESLDTLIADTRNAGTPVNTWIEVRNLGDLDDEIAKTAYRAMQEGLTNARRHAPNAPVSLEVTAGPSTGVLVHITNPMPLPSSTARTSSSPTHGAGLPGLAARVQAVDGECRYGADRQRVFHVDVRLPWQRNGSAPAAPSTPFTQAQPSTPSAPATMATRPAGTPSSMQAQQSTPRTVTGTMPMG